MDNQEACATAVGLPGDLRVAVNLSAAQFKNSGLVNVIASALANSGLPAEHLELEITETILLHDSEATLAMLYQLRALRVRIAIGRFRRGLFFVELSAALSLRQDQDRSLICERHC